MSKFLDEAIAKINVIEKSDKDKIKNLEEQVYDLQEAFKALLERMSPPVKETVQEVCVSEPEPTPDAPEEV